MCSTYPMMLWVVLGAGGLQDSCRLLLDRAVAVSPSGAAGSSGPRARASRALAWLLPALFSAMHW